MEVMRHFFKVLPNLFHCFQSLRLEYFHLKVEYPLSKLIFPELSFLKGPYREKLRDNEQLNTSLILLSIGRKS